MSDLHVLVAAGIHHHTLTKWIGIHVHDARQLHAEPQAMLHIEQLFEMAVLAAQQIDPVQTRLGEQQLLPQLRFASVRLARSARPRPALRASSEGMAARRYIGSIATQTPAQRER